MNRNELGALVFGLGLVFALAVTLALGADALARDLRFNVGANVIQWVSGVGLIAGLAVAGWARWHGRCRATIPCVRRGVHPVAGTTKAVCEKHHSVEFHEHVYDLHAIEGKLGWGQSHNREVAT